jgi:DnaJ-domain-containing protein 1
MGVGRRSSTGQCPGETPQRGLCTPPGAWALHHQEAVVLTGSTELLTPLDFDSTGSSDLERTVVRTCMQISVDVEGRYERANADKCLKREADGPTPQSVVVLKKRERVVLERSPGGILRDPIWYDPNATAHEILGVEAQASLEIVRRSYVHLIRLCHPDHFSDSPQFQKQAELATRRINEAYETLSRSGHSRRRSTVWAQRRRLHQNALLHQLPAADEDVLSNEQARAERVVIIVLTVVVWAVSTLCLVVFIAAWISLAR